MKHVVGQLISYADWLAQIEEWMDLSKWEETYECPRLYILGASVNSTIDWLRDERERDARASEETWGDRYDRARNKQEESHA